MEITEEDIGSPKEAKEEDGEDMPIDRSSEMKIPDNPSPIDDALLKVG